MKLHSVRDQFNDRSIIVSKYLTNRANLAIKPSVFITAELRPPENAASSSAWPSSSNYCPSVVRRGITGGTSIPPHRFLVDLDRTGLHGRQVVKAPISAVQEEIQKMPVVNSE